MNLASIDECFAVKRLNIISATSHNNENVI